MIDLILNYFTPFGWNEPRVKTSEPSKPVQVVQRGSIQVPQVLKVGHNVETGENFTIELKDYDVDGQRDVILASSGQGKSYLAGVLLEETLETGGIVCVIDPEGEWHTLAEKYPIIIASGTKANVKNPLVYFEDEEDEDPYHTMRAQIDALLQTVLGKGVSILFDVSEMINPEACIVFALIGQRLFELETTFKTQIQLFVEEAQVFAPERPPKLKKGIPVSGDVCQQIAKRGRKRALNSMWATQRPQALSKEILTQCNKFWFGGLTSDLDYKAVKSFLEEAGISQDQIRALQPGQFYFFSNGNIQLIKSRKRYCKHGGGTPKRLANVPRATKEDLQGILEGLK